MSPNRGWKIRLKDILASIEKIQVYTQSMTYEQFRADNKTVDAVTRKSSARPLATSLSKSRRNTLNSPGWKCAVCAI